MTEEYRPWNQETAEGYNREPGIVVTPGSNFAKEVSRFEQFPSQYTAGSAPGNPYTYRPYPKMLYRAQHYNGKASCMATVADQGEYKDYREYERAVEMADRFTAKCQRVVGSEEERARAMEDGWRESPQEAIDYLIARDAAVGKEAAHRNYDDRNMSELAKREIAAAEAASDGQHVAEIPRARVDGRTKAARAAKKAAQETPPAA